MKIKTYPLQFTQEKLNQIEAVAGKRKIKQFIYDAIEEKLLSYSDAEPGPEFDTDTGLEDEKTNRLHRVNAMRKLRAQQGVDIDNNTQAMFDNVLMYGVAKTVIDNESRMKSVFIPLEEYDSEPDDLI